MKMRVSLAGYLFRDGSGATALCTAALAAYVLLHRSPLEWTDSIALLILAVQSVILSRRLAWSRKGEAAFLYTRGYGRDVIWRQRVLVTLLSGAVSTGVGGILVWIGIRAGAQESMGNALFPIVSVRETWVPVKWLFVFILMTPLIHYANARRELDGKPTGYALVLLLVAMFGQIGSQAEWLSVVIVGVLPVVMCLNGMRLHRYLEVRS